MSEIDKSVVYRAITELKEGYFCRICKRKHYEGKPYWHAHHDYINIQETLKDEKIRVKVQEIQEKRKQIEFEMLQKRKKDIEEQINKFKASEFDANGYMYFIFIASDTRVFPLSEKGYKNKEDAIKAGIEYINEYKNSWWLKVAKIVILKAQFDEVIET
jgi:hypothetical protein